MSRGMAAASVAFDKRTGKVVYQGHGRTRFLLEPDVASIGGKRWCFYFARDALVGFDPKTGKAEFRFPWRAKVQESVNAATPVVVGDTDSDSGVLRSRRRVAQGRTGQGRVPIWSDNEKDREDKSLRLPLEHADSSLTATSTVQAAGTRMRRSCRCVELATGKVAWKEPVLSRCSLTK